MYVEREREIIVVIIIITIIIMTYIMPLLCLQSSEGKFSVAKSSPVLPQAQKLHVYGSGMFDAFEKKGDLFRVQVCLSEEKRVLC